MNKNDAVTYTGKGFLGFDKADTEMVFLEKVSFNSAYVLYKGEKMMVSPWEVKDNKK